MATLLERANLATDPDFQLKTRAYITSMAIDILNEDQSTMSPAKAAKRNDLANSILGNPDPMTIRFAWAASSKGTLEPETYTDGDLEYMISVSINALAGITAAD